MSLPPSIQKEQFSRAFVHAVATVAGCSVTSPTCDIDSVDLVIESRIKGVFADSPRLEVQTKCTASPKVSNGSLAFDLPMKNYRDLTKQAFLPRILVVAMVPGDLPLDWLRHMPFGLMVKCHAVWKFMRGQPDLANAEKTRVLLPSEQTFTVEGLQRMMQRIADGGQP